MMTTCSVCDRPASCRGWCDKHYRRWRLTGDPERTIGVPRLRGTSIAERLRIRSEERGGCVEWTGGRDADGYGKLSFGSAKNIRTHRAAWEIANGPIPAGLFVCHRCDNPACIKVEHLFLGDNAENMADMASKGRGKAPSGERHGGAKLTAEAVREIRAAPIESGAGRRLAARFGVSPATVTNVRKGLVWGHVV